MTPPPAAAAVTETAESPLVVILDFRRIKIQSCESARTKNKLAKISFMPASLCNNEQRTCQDVRYKNSETTNRYRGPNRSVVNNNPQYSQIFDGESLSVGEACPRRYWQLDDGGPQQASSKKSLNLVCNQLVGARRTTRFKRSSAEARFCLIRDVKAADRQELQIA